MGPVTGEFATDCGISDALVGGVTLTPVEKFLVAVFEV